MSESEKPFACPSPGCNMSFINEDHLTVHRKKHDMILNLGSNGKGNVFVADQTPTPTRFIRNCEEVGLFQDLQNVNPFEETFRRAVEAGKTGTLAVPEVGISDDTLHTPHIFPHMVDVPSTNDQGLLENAVADPSVINIADTSDNHSKNPSGSDVNTEGATMSGNTEEIKTIELDNDPLNQNIVETMVAQEKESSTSTTVINLNSGFQQKEASQLSINGKDVQLLMKMEDGKLMQLSAIPVSQAQFIPTVNVQPNTQTVIIKTEPSLNYSDKNRTTNSTSSRLSTAKMKLKQVLTKNSVASDNQQETESPTTVTIENKGDVNSLVSNLSKKQDILERNRASSMRARAKRKAWIQQLERSVYNVNEANAALQLEVRALRSEVAKLKTLLLAHKECPVTKAMEQGNSIVLGPKVISLNPDVIQATPLSAPGAAIKRASIVSTEVVTSAKRKPPTSGTTNPVILPKSSIDSFSRIEKGKIIRNVPGIKVVDVKHVVTKRDRGKQILIVQDQKRKSGENSRQIIRLNPNFELDNAASKSTGS